MWHSGDNKGKGSVSKPIPIEGAEDKDKDDESNLYESIERLSVSPPASPAKNIFRGASSPGYTTNWRSQSFPNLRQLQAGFAAPGQKRPSWDADMESPKNPTCEKKPSLGMEADSVNCDIGDIPYCISSENTLSPRQEYEDILSLSEEATLPADLTEREVYYKQQWHPYKDDLEIDSNLFKRGILVIRAIQDAAENLSKDLNSFSMGSRTLTFSTQRRNSAKTRKVAPETLALHERLQSFCSDFNFLNNFNGKVLYNQNRQEETFLPFVVQQLNNVTIEPVGFYVYPWLSAPLGKAKHPVVPFQGFKQFVTAGCIFGTSLQGLDQYNSVVNLIKHDSKFFEGQVITSIKFNSKKYGVYETVLFSELQKLALLINSLSNKKEDKKLYYHLPAFDYILFGLELFVRGRITLNALDKFLDAVQTRKEQFIQKVDEIFKPYKIQVTMGSPFEFLFKGLLGNGNQPTKLDAKSILRKFNINYQPQKPLDVDSQIEQECKFVQDCLMVLDSFENEHRILWRDFSIDFCKKTKIDRITTLDQLFKVANAIVIAIAAKGKNHQETCSLLPLSEKQIQVGYAGFNKDYLKENVDSLEYPVVINLTTVDPIISYDYSNDSNTNGLLFYFRDCTDKVNELIETEHFLDLVHANIAKNPEAIVPVERVIPAAHQKK